MKSQCLRKHYQPQSGNTAKGNTTTKKYQFVISVISSDKSTQRVSLKYVDYKLQSRRYQTNVHHHIHYS